MRFLCRKGLCLLLSGLIAMSALASPVSAAEQAADTAAEETGKAEAAAEPSDEIPSIERENWLSVTTEVLTYYAKYAAGLNPEASQADTAFYDANQDGVIDLADATCFLQIYAFYGASVPYEGYIPVRDGSGSSEETEPTATVTTTDEVIVTSITEGSTETTAPVSESTTVPTETVNITTASSRTAAVTSTVTTAVPVNTSVLAKPATIFSSQTTADVQTTAVSGEITAVSGSSTSTTAAVTASTTTGKLGGAAGYTETTTAVVTASSTAVATELVTRTPLTYGIDVSVYQGEVDWEAVKDSGVEFAIIRAGYGRHLNQEDKYFDVNMQNAKAAGIDCGAYWFSYATTPEAAVLEADVFYEVIKDYQFEYPVFFDYETSAQYMLKPEESTAIIQAFCKRMESYGYYVSLCSYVNFLNNRIEPTVFDDYDTWIAHYNVDVPDFEYDYGMWQYSCTGTVPGIDAEVDLNYAYKDYPQIMLNYDLNGFGERVTVTETTIVPAETTTTTVKTTTKAVTTTAKTTATTAKITTKSASTTAKTTTDTVTTTKAVATTAKTTTKAASTTAKTTTDAVTTTKATATTAKTTTKAASTTAKTTTDAVTTTKAAATTTVSAPVTRTPLTYGIDVSVYQGEVDWEAVKDSGVEFAIIRAGYGRHLNQEDKYFDVNMQNAKAAGIDCGAYWFSYATTPEAAVLEADVFYEVIKDYQFEYPVFFDYETSAQYMLKPEESTAIIQAFCKRMESYGYYVSLCSYVNFLNNRIEPAVFDDYDTWIAHYDVDVPNFRYNYGMWQYSCTGTVPGIDAEVDLNYAYKDYPQIMLNYDLNGFGERVTVTETTIVPAETTTTTVKTTTKAVTTTAKTTATTARSTTKAVTTTIKAATTTAKTTTDAAVTTMTTKTTTKAASTTTKATTTTVRTTTKAAETTTVSAPVTRTPLTYGIEVSAYQGEVDWEAVKDSGVEFAIIRAGYGRHLNQEDKYFDVNMQNAKAAGIDCGAYWFSYAVTPEEAILEADVFYEVIKGYQFEYPVFLDYETSEQYELTPEESTAIIQAFCERMESYGYYVSLSSHVDFLNDRIEPSVYEDYDTYIADYDADVPDFAYNYGIWQFSCTGTVPGISTEVRLSYAYNDYPGIMIYNKLNGF